VLFLILFASFVYDNAISCIVIIQVTVFDSKVIRKLAVNWQWLIFRQKSRGRISSRSTSLLLGFFILHGWVLSYTGVY